VIESQGCKLIKFSRQRRRQRAQQGLWSWQRRKSAALEKRIMEDPRTGNTEGPESKCSRNKEMREAEDSKYGP
jgi:hypothetical protein